jgi:regulator of protease activity HflC (stomatin/prohibitin superfamily)
MRRAMAAKAEANRQADAKRINAASDEETAQIYVKISQIYKINPTAMKLREYELFRSMSQSPGNMFFVIPSSICDVVKKNLS